jgi:LmbE family N-acetylglucosaminyl deacetylase
MSTIVSVHAHPDDEARRREAAASGRALATARIAWLGCVDSGMADAPTTGRGRLVDAPVEDAARALTAILDEENADILTGYDANGGTDTPTTSMSTASPARHSSSPPVARCFSRPPSTRRGWRASSAFSDPWDGSSQVSPSPATTSTRLAQICPSGATSAATSTPSAPLWRPTPRRPALRT